MQAKTGSVETLDVVHIDIKVQQCDYLHFPMLAETFLMVKKRVDPAPMILVLRPKQNVAVPEHFPSFYRESNLGYGYQGEVIVLQSVVL